MQNKESKKIKELELRGKRMKEKIKQLSISSGRFLVRLKERMKSIEENNLRVQARLNSEINDLVEKMDKKASQYFRTNL